LDNKRQTVETFAEYRIACSTSTLDPSRFSRKFDLSCQYIGTDTVHLDGGLVGTRDVWAGNQDVPQKSGWVATLDIKLFFRRCFTTKVLVTATSKSFFLRFIVLDIAPAFLNNSYSFLLNNLRCRCFLTAVIVGRRKRRPTWTADIDDRQCRLECRGLEDYSKQEHRIFFKCTIKWKWKSSQRRRKHCALAVVTGAKNFRPAADPLPVGAGQPKFNQLPLPTNPVWW